MSTVGEVNTTDIITDCLNLKKRLFVPYFQRNDVHMDMLELVDLKSFSDLKTYMWGIRQHPVYDDSLSWLKSGKNFGFFSIFHLFVQIFLLIFFTFKISIKVEG